MNHYTTHIKSKNGWFDIDLKELYQYRDLIWLFFKRNYSTKYKQTILGPLWLIFNPMITVILYAVIFGYFANLSTGGVPHLAFYLCSNSLWAFFSTCLTQTSKTFTENAPIMGKVYFPRLIMPLSSVVTGLLDLIIQISMLSVVMVVFWAGGYFFDLGYSLFLAPILVVQTGLLGLGCGIIVSSLTTKYRDLAVLVDFGVQLWMYSTPVVYTIELIPERYRFAYSFNAMVPIMECWRNATIGSGSFMFKEWAQSWMITILVLIIGILLFNKVEKDFMDTV